MSLRTNLNNWLAMSVFLLGLASNVAVQIATDPTPAVSWQQGGTWNKQEKFSEFAQDAEKLRIQLCKGKIQSITEIRRSK